jgi:ABC-type glycerol-3-phosphate transport system substrate-binding protein
MWIFRKLKRDIKYFFQRIIRGFDDSETWSLDITFAKWVVPRLKRFKIVNNAFPHDMTEESWDNLIDNMIDNFQYFVDFNNEKIEFSQENEIEALEKFNEGMLLFCKHIRNIWW